MLFVPSIIKHQKYQKGRAFNKIILEENLLRYGQLGLKFALAYRISALQLTALFLSLRKRIKRKGALVVNLFPQVSITSKPLEVRMGKGKGHISFWAARVRAGSTLCEVSTFCRLLTYRVLIEIRFKLPLRTKTFSREP
jgi:large subunit ribosomal protein L16